MIPSSSRMLCSSSTTSTRVSVTAGGEAKREDTAGPRDRFDPYLAAVILEDPVDQGEAESAATRLRGEERLEHVVEVVPSDSLSGVAHAHLELAVRDGGRHAQLAAGRHRLHGVEA